ncbi:acyl-CoA dehydrogenase family protein [Rugosimonospora africana]|uniref:Acyl-CoA dehydrogenase n=1 Tax=Rugosimonospora africana TaxID=556532 RepID=A0A8J3VRP6_9ACTN|nr:acyl-CoA dehydrogenase family protein [Rugosimonospora africana]GIH16450.1 acyl-CoA dehydrogenase [Rugosimonospora africana]
MSTLLYSDVEEDLRASVRQALDRPAGGDAWRALATGIGCAGLAVPEEFGGAGASWREAAVVAEEVGRAAAPVPWLGSVLGTAALTTAAVGTAAVDTAAPLSAGARDLLPAVASGDLLAVLVLPLSTPPGAPVPATVRADGHALTGSVTTVADAQGAGVLIVPTPDGLYAVDAAHAEQTPVTALDQTRPLSTVTFSSAQATRLGDGAMAGAAWAAALRIGAAVLAGEQLGVAEWCLSSTVDYVKTRYQFARPVGSFQAVKHRLAQLWVDVTQARAVARYAAGCVADDDPDAAVAASLAQAHCGPVAVRAAEECVQLHGGIGFTWEHRAHWYLKRAKAAAIALGTATQHRAALGDLVSLPPN